MTKRTFLLTVTLAVTFIWTVGCSSFPGFKGSSSSSPSSSRSSGSLYASVPAAMKAPVREASYDVKQSEANLKLAKEQVKLADLKKEYATLKKKRADLNEDLAKTNVSLAKESKERKKLEAIDNANLGDKAGNIKKIMKHKTKELSIESNAVKIKAAIDTLDLDIKKVNKKINSQARKVELSRKKR